MAQKIADYTIGFNADTTQLKQEMKSVQTQLNEIANFKFASANNGSPFTQEITKAAAAAKDLQTKLQAATNVKTGQLDLTKFNQSLQRSGMSIEQYYNKLSAIGPQGKKAFLEVANAISQAALPTVKLNGVMNDLWITMKNTMKWQLTSSVMHGFMSALSTSYGYARDLNTSLNSIRIVSGKSAEEMKQFAKYANDAAKSLSTTTTEYTDASLIYFQQGLPQEDVIERTNATIKMANVTGDAVADVSSQLTAIWNNFEDGTHSLEYYADVITALGAATASSSAEIANGLEKFASIANVIGLSYEYATTALATIVAQTRQSEDTVGTALKTIFARIQGLQLGETQDDGTDLNKYSKALAKVGIDIKDTNGEMKAMDTLLDELGNKWNNLAKDEQMALAQTVAGVRQYTQLISLMDNWAFFQDKLVNVVGNSEGTLQQQADIYAESWEAARDRVRAAWEQIYAAIFDDETFIGLTNDIGAVVEIFGDLIDGIGGLKGLLPLVGVMMTNAFGPQLANSLRSAKDFMSQLMGVTAQETILLKSKTADLVLSNNMDSKELQIQARKVDMQSQLYEKIKEIGSERAKQLELEIEFAEALSIQAETIEQQRIEAQQVSNETARQLQMQMNAIENSAGTWREQRARVGLGANFDTGISNLQNLSRDQGYLTGLKQSYESYLATLNRLRKEQQALVASNQQGSATYKQLSLELKKAETNFNLVNSIMQDYGVTYKTIDNEIRLVTEDINRQEQELNELANRSMLTADQLQLVAQRLYEIRDASTNAGSLNISSMFSQNIADNNLDEVEEKIRKASGATRDWASTIVNVANVLMSVQMGIQGIKQLGEIWNNDTLSTSEKLVESIGALSMVLFAIGPILNATKNAQAALTTQVILANTALTENQIASMRSAKGLEALKLSAQGASIAFEKLRASALGPIALVVAGLTATVLLTKKIADALTTSPEEAADKIKKSFDSYEEAKEKVSSLNSELTQLDEKIKNLESQKTLDFIEEQELEDLKTSRDLLEQQLELEKEIAEVQQSVAIADAKDNFSGSLKTINIQKRETIRNKIDNRQNQLETAQNKLLTANNEKDINKYEEKIKSLNQEIKNLQLEEKKWFSDQSQSLTDITKSWQLIAKGFRNGEIDDSAYQDLAAQYRNFVSELYDNDKAREFKVLLKPVLDSDAFLNYKKDIYNQLKDGSITKDDAPELYQKLSLDLGFKQVLTESGYTLDEFLQYLDSRVDDAVQATKGKFNDAAQEIDDTIASFDKSDWEVFLSLNLNNFDTWQEIVDYLAEQHKLTINFDLPKNINSVLETLTTPGKTPADLDAEQNSTINNLEQEYPALEKLIIGSHEYLTLLREIREIKERDAVETLKEDEKIAEEKAKKIQEELTQIIKDYNNTDSIVQRKPLEIALKLKTNEFEKALKELQDKKYEVQVQMKADMDSDIFDAYGIANEIADIQNYFKKGLEITFDEAQAISAAGYGAILQNAHETAYNTIKIDKEALENFKTVKRAEFEADRLAKIEQLENEKSLVIAQKEALTKKLDALKESLTAKTKAEKLASLETAKTYQDEYDAKTKELNELLNSVKETDEKEEEIHGDLFNDLAGMYDTNTMNQNTAEAEATNFQVKEIEKRIQNLNNLYNALVSIGKATVESATGEVKTPFNNKGALQTGGTSISIIDKFKTAVSKAIEERKIDSKDLNLQDKLNAAIDDGTADKQIEAVIKTTEAQIKALDAQIGDLDAGIAALKSADLSLDNIGNLKNSGSKTPDNYNPAKDKELERYIAINKQIEIQNNLISENDKVQNRTYGTSRFKMYDKEIAYLEKLSELYADKTEEAKGYLNGTDNYKGDLPILQDLFKDLNIQPILNEEQTYIENYRDLQEVAYKEYATILEKYNNTTDEAARKLLKDQMEMAEDLFDKRIKALAKVQETLDVIRENAEAQAQAARDAFDEKLDKLNYKFQLVLDVKQAKDDVREFVREIIDSFSDELFHGVKDIENQWDGAQLNKNFYSDLKERQDELIALLNSGDAGMDSQSIIDELNSLRGNIIETGENLLEFLDNLEHAFPDALKALNDRFNIFIDSLKHNQTTLSTINEILGLQGMTKNAAGHNAVQRSLQGQVESALAQSRMYKRDYDRARADLVMAETELSKYEEGDAGYDIAYNNWLALKEETEKAQEEWLNAAKDALQLARDKYIDELDWIANEFDKRLSNMASTKNLQDAYNNYIDLEDDFLDPFNRLQKTNALNRKVQNALDSATDDYQKKILKDLQDEFELRQAATDLSEYDIEIMEAKYNMTLKQIALEEAQNNKSRMALFRDGQGNWTYRYTADQDNVDAAQQEYDDAVGDWYNIAKNRIKDLSQEIVQLKSEMSDKIKEIYADENLTAEQQAEQIAIWSDFYMTKINQDYDQIEVAIQDMTEAGEIAIDDFENTFAEDIKDMIGEIGTFNEDFTNMIEDMKDAQNEYLDNTDYVTDLAGTDYEHLSDMIDKTNNSTEDLVDVGLDATDMMWDMADAVFELTERYAAEAESIMEVVRALQELARQNGQAVEDAASMGENDILNNNSQHRTNWYGDYAAGIIDDKQYLTGVTSDKGVSTDKAMSNIQSLSNLDWNSDVQHAYLQTRDSNGDYTYTPVQFEDLMRKLHPEWFETGGYTGNFDGGRLAVLHEKELVLNQEDTQNVLEAVRLSSQLRAIQNNLDLTAEQQRAAWGNILSAPSVGLGAEKLVQQVVSIDANFPGVQAAVEIEAAFDNMLNRAVQYASDRSY